MKKTFLFISLFTFIFVLTACEQTSENDRPIIPSGPVPDTTTDTYCEGQGYTYDYNSLVYELVWSDEFNDTSLDLTKWTYEVNGSGGGNQELQYYTNSNTSITDGILSITAKNESYEGREYTSSRIVTNNKGQWTYGIFEARIKLPGGLGTWPAFWMMPTTSRYGGWPDSGEIDIMVQVGYAENVIHGTIHTEAFNHILGTQKGGTYYDLTDAVDEFHIYKVEWLPDKLKFYIDGSEQTLTYTTNVGTTTDALLDYVFLGVSYTAVAAGLPQFYYNGFLFDVLAYSRALSFAEIQIVQTFLSNKWNIPIT